MSKKKKLKNLKKERKVILNTKELPEYVKRVMLEKFDIKIEKLKKKIEMKKIKTNKSDTSEESETEITKDKSEIKNSIVDVSTNINLLNQPLNNTSKVVKSLIAPKVTKKQLKQRSNRFSEEINTSSFSSLDYKYDSNTKIVGLSQSLEKQYYRLTGPADPLTVRPENVLFESFQYIRKKWMSSRNYSYVTEQLKSIRQDLLIQGIKNKFTVLVYETQCKISITEGDLNEYNQCQTELFELYNYVDSPNKIEFVAYRLLYNLVTVYIYNININININRMI